MKRLEIGMNLRASIVYPYSTPISIYVYHIQTPISIYFYHSQPSIHPVPVYVPDICPVYVGLSAAPSLAVLPTALFIPYHVILVPSLINRQVIPFP